MEILLIKKWGSNNDLRLPRHIMRYLGVCTEDKVKIIQEEVSGQKRLVIETASIEDGLTVEQLFESYIDGRNHVAIQNLGEVVGNEKR